MIKPYSDLKQGPELLADATKTRLQNFSEKKSLDNFREYKKCAASLSFSEDHNL